MISREAFHLMIICKLKISSFEFEAWGIKRFFEFWIIHDNSCQVCQFAILFKNRLNFDSYLINRLRFKLNMVIFGIGIFYFDLISKSENILKTQYGKLFFFFLIFSPKQFTKNYFSKIQTNHYENYHTLAFFHLILKSIKWKILFSSSIFITSSSLLFKCCRLIS